VTRTFKFIGALAIAIALIGAPSASMAGVFVGIGIGVSVNIAPPPIPVYVQPPVLVADDIWTPGYWAYGSFGYYWVPGTWVAAPQPGYLWTPGYWAYSGGAYGWRGGYWGPHIGFYGGVNYGFGYGGIGYVGGMWAGDHFRYNTAVTSVNTTVINNVYVNRTVVNNTYNSNFTRTSYNGGPEGIQARPSPQEAAYRSESHLPPTTVQQEHIQTASQNRNYLANVNHGRPADAAIATPLSSANRPANFAPAIPADKVGGQSPDAFSRFNQDRGTSTNAAAMSPNATVPADTYHAPASTYHAPANAYHPENAYHAPAHAYHAANAYHPANTVRAPKSAPRATPERHHDN